MKAFGHVPEPVSPFGAAAMNEQAPPPSTTPADSATTSTKPSSNPSPPRNSPPLPDNFDQMFCEALRRGIEKGIETP